MILFRYSGSFFYAVCLLFAMCHSLPATVLVGNSFQVILETEAGLGNGTLIDFTGMAGTRLTNQLQGTYGVTFESNFDIYGNPTGGLPVFVSSGIHGRRDDIVGTPHTFGTDDGRVGYQILFDSPQRWAGVQRFWNDGTLTQFYDSSNNLLFELTGEFNPYVGYYSDTLDTNHWISRIQIDTASVEFRQVGYTDNLVFGTGSIENIPEPAVLAYLLPVCFIYLLLRRRNNT